MYATSILEILIYVSRSVSATDSVPRVERTLMSVNDIEDEMHTLSFSGSIMENRSFQKKMAFIENKLDVLYDIRDVFVLLLWDNGHKIYTVLDNIIEKFINKKKRWYCWKQKKKYVCEKRLPIFEHVPEFFRIVKTIKEAKTDGIAGSALKVLIEMVELVPYCFGLTDGLLEMFDKAESCDKEENVLAYKMYCSFKKRLYIMKVQITKLRSENLLFFEEFFWQFGIEQYFKNTDGFFEMMNKEIDSAYVSISAFIDEFEKIDERDLMYKN
ncbi:hypothetical protein ENBRE01_0271 [Enteropsectra breve]|nr:hypothetical protein ENBRE01_0271 [Enteropsectra breve]